MNPATIRRAARLAVNVCSSIAAHNAGDHWVQDGADAVNKGQPGAAGRVHCLRHVAGYTTTHAVAQTALNRVVGVRTQPGVFLAGHLATGIAHYTMDRSRESARLLDLWDRTAARIPGLPAKREYFERGGQAALDQSWHWCCLMAWAVADADQDDGDVRMTRDGLRIVLRAGFLTEEVRA